MGNLFGFTLVLWAALVAIFVFTVRNLLKLKKEGISKKICFKQAILYFSALIISAIMTFVVETDGARIRIIVFLVFECASLILVLYRYYKAERKKDPSNFQTSPQK